jgi:U4/U6 small nuclear ribonucleoprotein PRP3
VGRCMDAPIDAVHNPRKRRRSRFAAAPSVPPSAPATGPAPAGAASGTSQPPLPTRAQTGAAADVSAAPPAALDLSAIPVAPRHTLKINQKVERTKRIKRSLKVLEGDLLETDPTRNEYFDPDIRMNARARRLPKHKFNFVTAGVMTEKAEKARHDAERHAADVRFRGAMAAKAARAGSLPPLPPLVASAVDAARGGGAVPDVEWWDAPFVANDARAALEPSSASAQPFPVPPPVEVRVDRITHYVHHPVSIPSYKPPKQLAVLPLMLTDKERKRLRRQRRLEKETEKREMIAVGLLPPPLPKVKLSNLMRVLATEATADPTQVEADVRAQVAERLRKHEADNEARKRTKEELREKAEARTVKDREEGLLVNVYRVRSVENEQHRFKVDMNARQLGLSGSLVVHADCNLVIVEGGSKALRKYKKLMLRRIDWTAPPPLASGSAAAAAGPTPSARPNQCVMVWEGPILKPAFDGFRTVELLTESSVKGFLRGRGMEVQFDVAVALCLDDASQGVRAVD